VPPWGEYKTDIGGIPKSLDPRKGLHGLNSV
jgi:hypothetical protein